MTQFDGTQAVHLQISGFEVRADLSTAVLPAGAVPRLDTWMEDVVQIDTEPVLAAQWDEIEELFSSHLERFDSLYRRLA